jgi:Na+/H+-dicarboxylate symporter
VATLPLTMSASEDNLLLDKKISRFVLPLCTKINMNGCAAFIFVTVIYLMQNHGSQITLGTMIIWILVSTVAAVGNAGVPMGCFFLSASLLASMNVPIHLLGIILPFYSIIDMLETALNVWSDSCVAITVNHKQNEGPHLNSLNGSFDDKNEKEALSCD